VWDSSLTKSGKASRGQQYVRIRSRDQSNGLRGPAAFFGNLYCRQSSDKYFVASHQMSTFIPNATLAFGGNTG